MGTGAETSAREEVAVEVDTESVIVVLVAVLVAELRTTGVPKTSVDVEADSVEVEEGPTDFM